MTDKTMTFDELMRKVLEILPKALLDEDMDGQIIIFTNKTIVDDIIVDFKLDDD